MYGKNNTTSENIDVYLQNKHLMENNNLSHYDSFYNPTYQGESQIHNNIVNQQNDTTNENNINNETNENNINENNDNDNDKKEEENNELEDPALKIFLDNKNDNQKKENDDEEDNLSDLSGESNDEKDFTDNFKLILLSFLIMNCF